MLSCLEYYCTHAYSLFVLPSIHAYTRSCVFAYFQTHCTDVLSDVHVYFRYCVVTLRQHLPIHACMYCHDCHNMSCMCLGHIPTHIGKLTNLDCLHLKLNRLSGMHLKKRLLLSASIDKIPLSHLCIYIYAFALSHLRISHLRIRIRIRILHSHSHSHPHFALRYAITTGAVVISVAHSSNFSCAESACCACQFCTHTLHIPKLTLSFFPWFCFWFWFLQDQFQRKSGS